MKMKAIAMLPQNSPSPLTSVKQPIGHPNWIYELKHDPFLSRSCAAEGTGRYSGGRNRSAG